MFETNSLLFDCGNGGRDLVYFANFRGENISKVNLMDDLNRFQFRNSARFMEWLPDNKCISIVEGKER